MSCTELREVLIQRVAMHVYGLMAFQAQHLIRVSQKVLLGVYGPHMTMNACFINRFI